MRRMLPRDEGPAPEGAWADCRRWPEPRCSALFKAPSHASTLPNVRCGGRRRSTGIEGKTARVAHEPPGVALITRRMPTTTSGVCPRPRLAAPPSGAKAIWPHQRLRAPTRYIKRRAEPRSREEEERPQRHAADSACSHARRIGSPWRGSRSVGPGPIALNADARARAPPPWIRRRSTAGTSRA